MFDFDIKEEVKAAFIHLLDISCRQLMVLEGIGEETEDSSWEDELLSVLEEKDGVIAYIDELYARLGEDALPVKQDPEIREILLFIKQQEDRSQEIINAKKVGLGEKIKALRQNEKARKAYAAEDAGDEGWFFDDRR